MNALIIKHVNDWSMKGGVAMRGALHRSISALDSPPGSTKATLSDLIRGLSP